MDIECERLRLRLLVAEDAERIAELAGSWKVASMTTRIPYPYTAEMAREWIESDKGRSAPRAVEVDGELVGVCGYVIARDGKSAELGYWLGEPYWGNGYATQAARATRRFVQEAHGISAFKAAHFVDNPGSQRVIEKLGFRYVENREMYCLARDARVDSRRYVLSLDDKKGSGR